MIDYIVIDDESNPRELLIYTINYLEMPFRLVGEAKNLKDGVVLIKKLKPQVVFLDIQMPNYNGLKIREFLDEYNSSFKLVFVTAFDQYTIQAIRLSAFDYLLKPIDENELKSCLERVLKEESFNQNVYKQLQSIENKNVLVLNSHEGTHYLDLNEIVIISADGMYSNFQLTSKKLISSKPLKSYEDIHPKLFRCHRSYIVNLDFIYKIEGQNLILNGGQEVPLSRQNKSKIKTLLESI